MQVKLASMLAARQAHATSAVTRSIDVSHSEMTTSVVLRSQSRGSRSFAAVPEMETRPEIASPPEPDVEIQVSLYTTCDGDLGATGPLTAEKQSEKADEVSRYVLGDRPEISATFSTELNPTENATQSTFHTSVSPNPLFTVACPYLQYRIME